MHFLLHVFQTTAFALVFVIIPYHINRLHLFWDTLYKNPRVTYTTGLPLFDIDIFLMNNIVLYKSVSLSPQELLNALHSKFILLLNRLPNHDQPDQLSVGGRENMGSYLSQRQLCANSHVQKLAESIFYKNNF